MRLRNLVILWIVLSLAVGLYTYIHTQEFYTLPFGLGDTTFELSLPIAFWVVVPLALFFVVVCVAIFVAKIKNNIRARGLKNDYITIAEQICSQATHAASTFSYKTEEMEKISRILQRFDLTPEPNSIPSGVEKIDSFLNAYKSLSEGEVVDIRRLGIANDSPLVLLEKKNRLSKDDAYASDVLKRNTETAEIKKIAFLALLENINTHDSDIRRFLDRVELDTDIARALLRVVVEQKITFNAQEVIAWIEKATHTSAEILAFTIKLKKILTPDSWLRFAEELADKQECAEETYLYVLADLEMISSLNDRLKHHAPNEFIHIRAFADLRDSGKNYPLCAFFKIEP